MDEYEIPVVDLSAWVGEREGGGATDRAEECKQLADALHRFGIVVVRDPRVSEVDNDVFLDQMEKYYAQSDGVKDARPEVWGFNLFQLSTIMINLLRNQYCTVARFIVRNQYLYLYSTSIINIFIFQCNNTPIDYS